MDLLEIQEKINNGHIKWRNHATRRLLERQLKRSNVLQSIVNGEIIEEYQKDSPFASCLILGYDENKMPIHTVCSIGEGFLWIITVYRPDPSKWESDFKTRKG